jgi:hypothetical protein
MTVFVFHLVKIISGFEVRLEQIFEILWGNSDSFVGHFDAHSNETSLSRVVIIGRNLNLNRVVGIGKLDSV